MVDRETVKKIVLDAIRENMSVASGISEDDELISDLDMSSLEIEEAEYTIALTLESRYNLKTNLNFGQLNNWCTVGEVIDYVVERCEEA